MTHRPGEARGAAGRERLYRLLLVVGSLLLGLAAAEIGLRLYHALRQASAGDLARQLERSRRASLAEGSRGGRFSLRGLVQASPVPELVYELKPLLDGEFKQVRVRTNSWGFRGPERELRKPVGTFRIVGLGDSMMFGWGVDQEEVYLARLERLLNARSAGGVRYEVLNLAVPGYNTTLEVESLAARGLAFGPDLVVLHFFRNDLGLPSFLRRPGELLSRRGLYLTELFRTALGRAPRAEPQGSGLVRHAIRGGTRPGAQEARRANRHLAGESAFRKAIERLAALARERSIPVVVLVGREPAEYAELVREVTAAQGFHLLETAPRFLAHLEARGLDESVWEETFWVAAGEREDPHPNALGHSLIAEALLGHLVERGLVPG